MKANAYALVVPDRHAAAATERPWRAGKIHGVRPAFRELGLPASFACAVLEHASEPLSGREIAHDARLGVQTTYDALDVLVAFGLARRTRHGFVLGPASLNNLAERFGIDEQIRAQLTKYREERRAWWALLGIIRLGDAGGTRGHYGPAPPPPDDVEPYTLLDMLEDMLGAHVIDEEAATA